MDLQSRKLNEIEAVVGVTAVGLLRERRLEAIWGQFKVDEGRLMDVITRNLEKLKEHAKVTPSLAPFRGFAMVLDDVGLFVYDDLVVLTDAKKVDWDRLVKAVTSS
ncbi:hypothetical protein HS1genome_1533 [Sulfodiicoccus acidiphilus]|uniref:Uncharacterized protein n=1 Tax=Sulfodiicoccus acidiphilus TaxID=1670455 RepID=A0A348B4P2_9CREN|nr:hypothetical protein [Sulfodiicoccus acidiphilus]BBD73144.1 hypothetical protein HS1genome_1533 [Sulfodiicoccus acidiphilus]GGU00501.1 hypothetical protein GCM10007116_17160 [Sulfodiicoccus acidiphilus]